MANWHINKGKWYISWYNFRNEKENDYRKKYNEAYQGMKKLGISNQYFKYIFKIEYNGCGIEFVHKWDVSHLVWVTKKNLYWFIWRDSDNCDKYGKWKLRCFKSSNDGVSCG